MTETCDTVNMTDETRDWYGYSPSAVESTICAFLLEIWYHHVDQMSSWVSRLNLSGMRDYLCEGEEKSLLVLIVPINYCKSNAGILPTPFRTEIVNAVDHVVMGFCSPSLTASSYCSATIRFVSRIPLAFTVSYTHVYYMYKFLVCSMCDFQFSPNGRFIALRTILAGV